MSMYNGDFNWSRGDENFMKCLSNSLKVRDYAHRCRKGHWSFLGQGNEQKMEQIRTSPKENRSAEINDDADSQ